MALQSKTCLGCNKQFDGRPNAKVCSSKCRKRFFRARQAIEQEVQTLADWRMKISQDLQNALVPQQLTPVTADDGLQTYDSDYPADDSAKLLDSLNSSEAVIAPTEPRVVTPTPPAAVPALAPIASVAPPPVYSQAPPPIISLEARPNAEQWQGLQNSWQNEPAPQTIFSSQPSQPPAAQAVSYIPDPTIESNSSPPINWFKSKPLVASTIFVVLIVLLGGFFALSGLLRHTPGNPTTFTINNIDNSVLNTGDFKLTLNLDTQITGKLGIGTAPTGTARLQVAGDIQSTATIFASGGDSSLNNDGLTINKVVVCTSTGCIPNATSLQGLNGVNGTNGISGPKGDKGDAGAATCPFGNCVSLQPSSPGTAETGNINVSGGIIAATFSGSGASLNSLNASNLTSGTLSVDRIADNSIPDTKLQTISTAGKVADSALSANVALLDGTGPQTFTGNNKFTGTVLSQNTTDSTAAFQIQNASGSSLFNADTKYGQITVSRTSSDYSDEFGAGSHSNWSFVTNDASTYDINSTTPGKLFIDPNPDAGTHDCFDVADTCLRLVQTPPSGDFMVETKIDTTPSNGSQALGLLFWKDASNMIRFEYDSTAVRVHKVVGGVGTGFVLSSDSLVANPVYLRTNRVGNTWYFSYSTDGITWANLGSIYQTLDLSGPGAKVGLALYNNAGSFPSANFDYFHLTIPTIKAGQVSIQQSDINGGTMNNSNAFAIQDAAGTAMFVADTAAFKINVGAWALFKNASNSTTALQVQNSTAQQILTVDTLNNKVTLGHANVLDAKLSLASMSGAGSIDLVPANPSGITYTITVPAATGTVCLTSGNCAGVGGTGDILNGGNTTGAAITIGTNDNFGLNLETNNTTVASLSNSGAALFKNASDSATAFRVQNAAGNNYILVNSSGASVSLGDAGIASTIQIGNTTGAVSQTINIGTNATSSSTSNINIGSSIAGTTAITGATTVTNRTSGSADSLVVSNSTSTGNIAVFKDNSTTVATIADGGAVVLQNAADSTAAFQVKTLGGNQILTIDTSGSQAVLGKASTLDGKLVLNSASGSGSISLTASNPGSTAYSILFPAANGTVCLTSGNCSGVGGSGDVLQGGNTFGAALTLGTNDNFGFNLEVNNTTVASLSNTGAALFKNSSNSTTAFQIQDAGGVGLLVADSSNKRVYVGDPATDTTGTLLVLDTKTSAGDPTGVNGSFYYNSNAGKFRCYEGGAWTNCLSTSAASTLQDVYDNSSSPANITLADGKDITLTLANTATDPNFLVNIAASAGGKFAVQNAGTDSFSVNSSGNTTIASGKTLTVAGGATSLTGASSGDALTISNSTSTGNIVSFKDNSTTVAAIADGGAVLLQNTVNSTAGFQIQNSAGTQLFVADTLNSQLKSGSILALAAPNSTLVTQTQTNVVSTNDVGQYASVATGNDSFPIIAYYDNTNKDLDVVHCTSISCSTSDTPVALDQTGNVGQYASIQIGNDGFPLIAYYDLTNTSLKIVHCTSATCSSNDAPVTVDNRANINNTGTGVGVRLAIGSDGFGVMAYWCDGTSTANQCGLGSTNGLDLMVAHCTNTSCSTNNGGILAEQGNSVGAQNGIAIGQDGYPLIASESFNGSDYDLRVVHCKDVSCSTLDSNLFETTTVQRGHYPSVVIGNNGLGIISYGEDVVDGGHLWAAHCNDQACSGITSVKLDTTAANVQYTSIKLGVDGVPVIAFYGTSSSALYVLKCSNDTCSSSSGNTITQVDNTNTDTGSYASMVVPTDGLPFIAYYDNTGQLNLRATKCATPACNLTSAGSYSGGYNIGSSTNFFNSVYAVSYFGKNLSLSSFDLAEEYEVEDRSLAAGEVVALNSASGKLKRASANDRSLLLGAISTEPGLALRDYQANRSDTRLIALSGRVPIKVKGPVAVGDPLTISDTPGVAAKALSSGLIVGRALEASNAEEATIKVFVQTTYYNPAYDLQAEATVSSLAVSGSLTSTSLSVEGAAVFKGQITLSGHIITQGEAPSVSAGDSAGAGASVSVEGNDQSGILSLQTGSDGLLSGNLVKLKFVKPYTKAPKVILTPANAAASSVKSFCETDADSFNIRTVTTPDASSNLKFYYLVVQ